MKICPECQSRFENDKLEICPKDGQDLESDMSALVGTTLAGKYKLLSMLGQGGMGAVYHAEELSTNQEYAIKILPFHLSNNKDYLTRFEREIKAIQLFKHPNVVKVHDFYTQFNGLCYMALDYIKGQSLKDELATHGAYSPVEALRVLVPIMNALAQAHKAGVVHRDLKPENIMVARISETQSTTKLLDLGIAKLHAQESSEEVMTALTATGELLGTPFYMSPEQWNGTKEIDGRADIYSCAIIFYEIIANELPFAGDTLFKLIDQHLFKNPPLLHENVANVPIAFGQAIAKAMSKKPNQRQASFEEFAKELRAALELNTQNVITLDNENIADLVVAEETVKNFRAKDSLKTLKIATLFQEKKKDKLNKTNKVQEEDFLEETKIVSQNSAPLVNTIAPQNPPKNTPKNKNSLPKSEEVQNIAIPKVRSSLESASNKKTQLILQIANVLAGVILLSALALILIGQSILAIVTITLAIIIYFLPQLTMKSQIEALTHQKLIDGLNAIEEDFRETFEDPYFRIPGASPMIKWRNFTEGILRLDKKTKKELFRELEN